MNRFFILLTIFLYAGYKPCYGQQDPDLNNLQTYYPDFNSDTYAGNEKIPFNSIIIKDYRFDTTKIGYVYRDGYQKISFRPDCSQALSAILNAYFKKNLDPSSNKKLVIVLKTFWMQKGAVEFSEEDNKVSHNTDILRDKSGVCFADLDVFSKDISGYKALVRLKSAFPYFPYKPGRLMEFITLPFDSLAVKLKATEIEKTLADKNIFSAHQLDANYQNRYSIPVLDCDSTKKGIFLTFKDFTSNKTVYQEFRIKEDKLTDQLYLTGNGAETLLTEYWGFYDGHDYYMKLGFNVFKLTRQNNTWDLYGSRRLNIFGRTTNAAVSNMNLMLNSQNSWLLKRPLQLNMVTGNVY